MTTGFSLWSIDGYLSEHFNLKIYEADDKWQVNVASIPGQYSNTMGVNSRLNVVWWNRLSIIKATLRRVVLYSSSMVRQFVNDKSTLQRIILQNSVKINGTLRVVWNSLPKIKSTHVRHSVDINSRLGVVWWKMLSMVKSLCNVEYSSNSNTRGRRLVVVWWDNFLKMYFFN